MTSGFKVAVFGSVAFVVAALHQGGVFAHQAGVAGAETKTSPALIRSNDGDSADAPSGRLLLRMPSADESSEDTVPSTEGTEPPSEPGELPIEEDDNGPVIENVRVSKRSLFIIDVSISMREADMSSGEDCDGNVHASMTREMAVKTELVKMIRRMDESYWFNIVWQAGSVNNPPNTSVWSDGLTQCTAEIRERAVEDVLNKELQGGTPTWKAFDVACNCHTDDVELLVFLTDGVPFPGGSGEWGDRDHADAVLEDFPAWFADKKANGCRLVGIHVGPVSLGGRGRNGRLPFMQEWCSQNGAEYIHKQ